MSITETSTPEPGPASEQPSTLDGVLESVIAGEFTPGDAKPTSGTPRAIAGESSAEPVPQPLAAPKTWPAEQREAFEQLPEDQREFMINRERERDAAFTRKTTELSEQRKQLEGLDGVLAPYKQQMQAHGISEAEDVSRLMSYDNALRQNPQAAIQQLAQHYGVQLPSGDSGADYVDEQPTDLHTQQLQQQLAQTQQQVNMLAQSQHQERYRSLEDQVGSFANAKDADGNLKHPHFEQVRERMSRLVTAGETQDLEAAYGMAIRLDETLYKDTLEKERLSVSRKEDAKRKAAITKAKKTRPSQSAASPPSGVVNSTGLDDILRDKINSARA